MTKKAISAVILAVLTVFTAAILSSCGGEAYAVKYGSFRVTEGEYNYWLSTLKAQVLSTYNDGKSNSDFWDTEYSDGRDYAEIFSERILQQIKSIPVILSLYDEYGLSLNDSVYDAIDEDIDEKAYYVGSMDEIDNELAEYGINVDVLREIYVTQAKMSMVRDHFSDLTQADLSEYFSKNYRAAKLIAIYTGIDFARDSDGGILYDENGNAVTISLDEYEKGQKLKLVDAVLAALDAGADVDECIAEFSEADYSDYPRGFFLSEKDAPDFGADIVGALFSLDVGKAKSVTDGTVTFIVYRAELPEYSSLTSNEKSLLSGLADNAVDDLIDAAVAERIDGVEVNGEIIEKYDIRKVKKNSYY